ncbi:hypothetical protein SADUNF_Sadunf01G0139400 [Salix dunnii]|uniref:X8 domain-containing protein n=1 Tax=Salix dunnii TaxID=1413687 RepID=A0A835NC19_9ROSI|nr:hypothetical protein SADUNF_Sadunf01G0139400 [Salix dunnii]
MAAGSLLVVDVISDEALKALGIVPFTKKNFVIIIAVEGPSKHFRNEEVLGIGESPSKAVAWINQDVAAYLPSTNITSIAVGSEVLTSIPNLVPVLVPAMNYLHKALVASNLNFQLYSLSDSSILEKYRLVLHVKCISIFWIHIWKWHFPLDYALSRSLPSVKQIVDPNTLSHYDSMFDALVDATYYSIEVLNLSGIPIVVTETGWPWLGGANEPMLLQIMLRPSINQASYASNDYYKKKKRSVGAKCDFDGTVATTTVDPGHGSCKFTGSVDGSISLENLLILFHNCILIGVFGNEIKSRTLEKVHRKKEIVSWYNSIHFAFIMEFIIIVSSPNHINTANEVSVKIVTGPRH